MKILILASSVVLTATAATFIAVPAEATPVSAVSASTATSAPSSPHFSDRDVLAYLTSGSGPLGEKHPELRTYVPAVAPLSESELTVVLAALAANGLDFHAEVAAKLQSANAFAALDALNSFQAAVAKISTNRTALPDGTATGDCVVVVAAGLLVVVAVAVKLWTVRDASMDDTSRQFAADVATAFEK